MTIDIIKDKIDAGLKEITPDADTAHYEAIECHTEEIPYDIMEMRLQACKLAFTVAKDMDELKEWEKLEAEKKEQRLNDIMKLRDMIYEYVTQSI